MVTEIRGGRLAAIQKVWTWLSEKTLHTLRKEEGDDVSREEAQGAGVKLPKLPSPDHSARCIAGDSRSGYEDECNYKDRKKGKGAN